MFQYCDNETFYHVFPLATSTDPYCMKMKINGCFMGRNISSFVKYDEPRRIKLHDIGLMC